MYVQAAGRQAYSYQTLALQTACLLYATESDKLDRRHLHTCNASNDQQESWLGAARVLGGVCVGWHRGQDKTTLATPSSCFLLLIWLFRHFQALKTGQNHVVLSSYSYIHSKLCTWRGKEYWYGFSRAKEYWYGFSRAKEHIIDTYSHVPRSTDTDFHVPRSTDTGFYNCTCTLWLPHWNPYLRASEVYDKTWYNQFAFSGGVRHKQLYFCTQLLYFDCKLQALFSTILYTHCILEWVLIS